jgi:hypothetical protein
VRGESETGYLSLARNLGLRRFAAMLRQIGRMYPIQMIYRKIDGRLSEIASRFAHTTCHAYITASCSFETETQKYLHLWKFYISNLISSKDAPRPTSVSTHRNELILDSSPSWPWIMIGIMMKQSSRRLLT